MRWISSKNDFPGPYVFNCFLFRTSKEFSRACRSRSPQIELTAYRITQQVPLDDAMVRCQYTVRPKEVFQLLQTLRKIHLPTIGQRGANACALYTLVWFPGQAPNVTSRSFKDGGWFVAPIWLLSQSSLGDDASAVSPVCGFPVSISHPHTDQENNIY
ncbi:hypothetical protein T09_9088 [Trichinella sp. T9]|nr:hypothetical protein T09_9088 [Trichinella sp. T9]